LGGDADEQNSRQGSLFALLVFGLDSRPDVILQRWRKPDRISKDVPETLDHSIVDAHSRNSMSSARRICSSSRSSLDPAWAAQNFPRVAP
jgi:hypothetical protein